MKTPRLLCMLFLGVILTATLSISVQAQKGKPQPPPPPVCSSYEPAIAFIRRTQVNRFTNKFELTLMNADGSCAKALYASNASYGQVSWSPDGRYLAFDTNTADPNDSDETDLFVVAVPPSFDAPPRPPCVVPTPELGLSGRDWPNSPIWSPVPLGNGTHKLAYRTNVPMQTINPDGSTSIYNGFALFLVDITATTDADGGLQCTSSPPLPDFSLRSPDFDVYGQAWSPDGKYLAVVEYTRPESSTPEGWDLVVYPVIESNGSVSLGPGVNITPPTGSTSYTGELAVFSADWGKHSNKIVFQAGTWDGAQQRNGGGGLYVTDLGADVATALLSPPPPYSLTYLASFLELRPTWSDDDTKVVFEARTYTGNKLSKSALYTVFASGSDANNPALLATPSDSQTDYYQPVWRR